MIQQKSKTDLLPNSHTSLKKNKNTTIKMKKTKKDFRTNTQIKAEFLS